MAAKITKKTTTPKQPEFMRLINRTDAPRQVTTKRGTVTLAPRQNTRILKEELPEKLPQGVWAVPVNN